MNKKEAIGKILANFSKEDIINSIQKNIETILLIVSSPILFLKLY